MLLYFTRGCWHLRGGGRNLSSAAFLVYALGLWIAHNACLLHLLFSPSSTICNIDVFEMAFGFNFIFFKYKWYFFRYESTGICWIFYLGSSSCTCEVTSVQTLVLLSSDKSSCQSYKAKINLLPRSPQLIAAVWGVFSVPVMEYHSNLWE